MQYIQLYSPNIMVAHKPKIKKKHKQHGRIIAAQTSALTKSPLSTKTKFLFEPVCPIAQNNAWKRYAKRTDQPLPFRYYLS